MTDPNQPDSKPSAIALWRYQVIAVLLTLSSQRGALKAAISTIISRLHDHPQKGAIKLGFGTVEEWYYAYKRDGLNALTPRTRRDKSQSRAIDDEMKEAIEGITATRPGLDGIGILKALPDEITRRRAEAAARGEEVISAEITLPSRSSLYRYLRVSGHDRRNQPARRDHRAYAFDLAGDCWQADVMYGPSIPAPDGSRRKTYLIAILDDATRVVVHAQFYFEQHLRSFKDCLKQAFQKRGLPRRLYMDNGQIFRSRAILMVGALLGILIIHTRPYRPQGRAKLERWFGTVRRCFLRRLDVNQLGSLDALNRALFTWIEGDYHVSPHRGLEMESPIEKWLRTCEGVRLVPPDLDLDELFLETVTRRTAKDGTIALRGKHFEAGVAFIGDTVTVRFDPFDLRAVRVTGPHGDTVLAYPVDLSGNRRVRRLPLPEDTSTPSAPQPTEAGGDDHE